MVEGQGETEYWRLLPEVNKMPLSTFNADFNQKSSVLAKCKKWQDIWSPEEGI